MIFATGAVDHADPMGNYVYTKYYKGWKTCSAFNFDEEGFFFIKGNLMRSSEF